MLPSAMVYHYLWGCYLGKVRIIGYWTSLLAQTLTILICLFLIKLYEGLGIIILGKGRGSTFGSGVIKISNFQGTVLQLILLINLINIVLNFIV